MDRACGAGKSSEHTPEEFARFIRDEITKWGKVVKAAGLRVE